MKHQRYFFIIVSVICMAWMGWSAVAFAQGSGYLAPGSGEQDSLPSGATYENGVVSHPITSTDENLHLLAGYYYNNPRAWKKIYNANRKIIRNPNRLPVGKTLKIHVGEGWKPRFSYTEWLQTANRNGQWKAGEAWRRARGPQVSAPTAGTEAAPAETPVAAPQPEQPAQDQPAAEPTPEATPAPEQPAAEATATQQPEQATQDQPAAEATATSQPEQPAQDQPAAEATPAPEETPAEKSKEEVAPQF